MSPLLIALGVILLVALIYVVVPVFIEAIVKFRGKRVIECPETKTPAAVDVNSLRAGATAALGRPSLRISDCSRWPARNDCGQECLAQIESSPEDCLVRTLVQDWYAGQACVLCQKTFGRVPWSHHRPALIDPQGAPVAWDRLRAESLADTLSDHRPICWNCYITESFRREHPDLVVYRPASAPPRKSEPPRQD